MGELIGNLKYVRSLLVAMSNLNEEELQVRGEMRGITQAKNVQLPKSNQKAVWIVLLIIGCILMTLFLALTNAPGKVRDSERAYEKALVDDEFNWTMQHYYDDETYPGYSGSVEEPITFGTAYVRSIPWAGVVSIVMTVILGAIIFGIQQAHNASVDRENKRRTEKYQAIVIQNNQIIANNQKIQEQIEGIHRRKQMISQEYVTSICSWFPREYCYIDAVDFFIHELELGTATTFPEAIKNYREFLFRKQVTDKLGEMNDKISVMIENQNVMIKKQDEMIRQQMIGNFISAATWMETRNIANSARNIEHNTSMTATYASQAASAASKTADTVSRMANRW